MTVRAGTTLTFDFASQHESAAGVAITSTSAVLVGSSAVVERGASEATYDLDTPFQEALSSPAWQDEGTVGSLTYFRATTIRASDWLGTHATTSRILKIVNATWGDSWVTIDATHPTVLKRSMEWIPGWRATAVNLVSGEVEKLHVVRSGLIQQVIVPPGTWRVHFHYHAPFIDVGLAGSVGGTLLLLGAILYVCGWVPRRRKGKVRP